MTHQEQRLFKVQWLVSRISACSNAGLACDKEKLIAECCSFFGSSRRYVLEYIKELSFGGKIVEDQGKLYLPEHYKTIKSLDNTEDQVNKIVQEEKI